MALENMGAAAVDAVPALAKALDDPEPGVRQAAVKALGAIGPAARAAFQLSPARSAGGPGRKPSKLCAA